MPNIQGCSWILGIFFNHKAAKDARERKEAASPNFGAAKALLCVLARR
jgi:hypothetical protein